MTTGQENEYLGMCLSVFLLDICVMKLFLSPPRDVARNPSISTARRVGLGEATTKYCSIHYLGNQTIKYYSIQATTKNYRIHYSGNHQIS